MGGYCTLEIAEIRKVAEDAICIALAVPESLKEDFRFIPGQYLTVKVDIDGDSLIRPYSICSTVSSNFLQIGVRKLANGRFSEFAVAKLEVGQQLQVKPPQGRFRLSVDDSIARNYLLIASGSGITPILSILSAILSINSENTVTLLYGNRSSSSTMFMEDLLMLKNKYLAQFQYFNFYSREQQQSELFSGRLDVGKVKAITGMLIDPKRFDDVFICGPGTMCDELSQWFAHQGKKDVQIRTEIYTSSTRVSEQHLNNAADVIPESPGIHSRISIVLNGKITSVVAESEFESILSTGLNHGLDIPYSCKSGVCATCKAKLLSGKVRIETNHVLTEEELQAGYILTCQSYPSTESIIVDLDV